MIRQNFNDGWQFADFGECRDIFDNQPEFTEVQLPHDAMIMGERREGSINKNTIGFFQGSTYVYKKIFLAEPEYCGKKILLEFEGVYMNAMVYINGQMAGKCLYGYTNFFVSIGHLLEFGVDNEIKVIAKTGMELTSRWYSGSGIYRSVNLLIGNSLHIRENGIKVDTKSVAADGVCIEAAADVLHEGSQKVRGQLQTDILDSANSKIIHTEMTPFTIFPGEEIKLRQRIYSTRLRRWEPENTNMYRMKCRIITDDTIIDEADARFGIRKLELDAKNGLRINGKKIKLRGACIHHDNGVIGAVTLYQAEERRVRLLKEAGFNAIRSAHNPISRELLRACDKYGMLVIDEAFDMWNIAKAEHDYAFNFSEHWEKDLAAMVDKDYNHPCVIMYMIGNEIQEIGTPQGASLNRQMAEFIRNMDASRYVGNAINGMFTVMEHMNKILPDILNEAGNVKEISGDINDFMTLLDSYMGEIMEHEVVGKAIEEACASLDVCGYNYMDSRYVKDGKQYPNRIIVGSETNPDKIGYNWPVIEHLPYVIGDFVWTGWDYIGESGIGKIDYGNIKAKGIYGPYPWYLAHCGDIDICGNRRPQSFYREIVWGMRKKPYIAVQRPQHYGKQYRRTNWSWSDSINSWTWPGYEGKPIIVEIYSAHEEVELLINDISMGRKQVGEEIPYQVRFDTLYQAGTITAASYKGGRECSREVLKTAGEAAGLLVTADSSALAADGRDIAFLDIAAVDSQGDINTSFNGKVAIVIEGPGIVQGFGSADPCSKENFFDRERTMFDGRLLAVIRTVKEEGEIKITLKAERLQDKEVKLTSKYKKTQEV